MVRLQTIGYVNGIDNDSKGDILYCEKMGYTLYFVRHRRYGHREIIKSWVIS